jgi:hypothetical protein
MKHFFLMSVLPTGESTDPISAVLARDWAAVGGWSLFLGLCLLIVVGAFREWWVPGGRYRRLEDAATKQSDTLATTAAALDKQVTANEIVKHFFEETTPKRREVET